MVAADYLHEYILKMFHRIRTSGETHTRAALMRPLACIIVSLGLAACSIHVPVSGGAAEAEPESAAPAAPIGSAAGVSDTAAAVRIRILATSDFHGRLLPEHASWAGDREVGGAAAMAAHLARKRAAFDGPSVLLDGGDLLQGSPLSDLVHGRVTVEYYELAGYDAVAIGNHELDWGTEVLAERVADARFPWLAANVFVAGSDTAPAWATPAVILDVVGVRVGLIGMMTEATPQVSRPANVAGLEFGAIAEALDRWVPELRAAGADFVIAVGHVGAVCPDDSPPCEGELVDVARAVTHRPDLMLGGHTHQIVRDRVNGIPLVQPGAYGTRFAVVDLVRISEDSVAVRGPEFVVPYADIVEPHPEVAMLVESRRLELDRRLNEIIAELAEPITRRRSGAGGPGDRSGEYALGRLIADAQRAATGAELAIMNNGGIRTDLEAGPLTWGMLYQLQPFQNRLVLLRLRGEQIRAALEHALAGERPMAHVSGMRVRYDPSRPAGERFVDAELDDGRLLEPDREYIVAVNDFLAEGGDGYDVFTRALGTQPTGIVDLDALVDFVRALPQPVRGDPRPRFRSARTISVSTPPGPATALVLGDPQPRFRSTWTTLASTPPAPRPRPSAARVSSRP